MSEGESGGNRQTWSAGSYERHARFVSDLAGPVVEWLAPRPGERILDLGCGDGVLTAELARSGATLVGVDSSGDLVAAARARGLDIRLMNGEALSFGPEFDAVFSNAALHWMPNAGGVVTGVARALKPGGRFAVVDYYVSRAEAAPHAQHGLCRRFGVCPQRRAVLPIHRHLQIRGCARQPHIDGLKVVAAENSRTQRTQRLRRGRKRIQSFK